MHYLVTLVVLTFVSHCCVALPGLIPDIFIPSKPPAYYTPSLYPTLFPFANYVGAFLGPPLKAAIGDDFLEQIDVTADYFCVAAPDDTSGKGGVCQRMLSGLYELGIAHTPAGKSKLLRFLAYTACIAPNTSPPLGSCQAILGLTDCVANRLVQVKDLECTKKGH